MNFFPYYYINSMMYYSEIYIYVYEFKLIN